MRSIFSYLLAIILWGTSCFSAQALPIHGDVGTLPGISHLFAGHPPEKLGVHNQTLSPCPESPNCVLSQNADEKHAIAPLTYNGDTQTAKETLLKVLSVIPRTSVIKNTNEYIRVEFQTQLMGFIDDGEFHFNPDKKIIHVRSASRLGESDLGLNHRRIEQIRLAMADLEA